MTAPMQQISCLIHYMSNSIFLEGACIGFSSLGCMRVEKTGFEQDRIAPFACFHAFWESVCSKMINMRPGNFEKSW